MKSHNLNYLASCPLGPFDAYESFSCGRYEPKTVPSHEHETLQEMVKVLGKHLNGLELQDYFFSYEVPHIGKEMDLLKVTENACLNIELKLKTPKHGEEGIRDQLLKNKFYLRLLGKELYQFTMVIEEEKYYRLNSKDKLIKVEAPDIARVIQEHFSGPGLKDDRELFADEQLLVSPLNDANGFRGKNYYLTNSQQTIKADLLRDVDKDSFFRISGSFGTGKTLLVYDLAHTLADNGSKRVLVVHAAPMPKRENGIEKIESFSVKPISALLQDLESLKDYDYILIDEAQRLYENTFEKIIKIVRKAGNVCIFATNPDQFLSRHEKLWEIDKRIENLRSRRRKGRIQSFHIKRKVRVPYDIQQYIYRVFSRHHRLPFPFPENVTILYSQSPEQSIEYIRRFQKEGYQFLNYSMSNQDKEKDRFYKYKGLGPETHRIIGQEFPKVSVVMDENFFYGKNGNLQARGHLYESYDYLDLLRYNLTRATRKLLIIVENNPSLLEGLTSTVKKKNNKQEKKEQK